MSKPLSWRLDDYPKLRIDHPWLKNAIEKLEGDLQKSEYERGIERQAADGLVVKVERLEGKYSEAAKLADERRGTLRQKQDEIYRLTNKVERLTASLEKMHTRSDKRDDEIEREARIEGMDAAEKIAQKWADAAARVTNDPGMIGVAAEIVTAIHTAAAKEQT